jgi:antitoxin component YwqK of YwqJK toxin-antitoxin module
LKDSKIEDDYLTSTYENSKYIINLKTSSRNEDFAYNSVITYSLVLIKKEGIYDEDNGDRVQYWEGTSRIQTKYKLKNGELNGEATSYYANGQVELKGNWFNGEKSGRFEEYDEEGIKTYEYYTSNGKQNGEYIEYYSNGKVKKRGNYVNDKELGFFTEYNENGSKKIEYNMLEDQLNGTYISYYDSGQIRMNGVFKDGKKHGYFVEYDEYGVRMDEYNMENGISHGFFIFYLNDGKISQKGNHVKGKKSGLFSEYDKNSNLVITYEMENDKLHGIYKKYSNNEVVTQEEYLNGTLSGNYKNIFYVGDDNEYKILETGGYKNDKKHGTWKVIITNENKLFTLTNYQNGIKDGAFQEVEGDSLIFGTYVNGLLNAEFKIYRDLTKMFMGGITNTDSSELLLMCEGMYLYGKKGIGWKYYDFSDQLIAEGDYKADKKYGRWDYYYSTYSNMVDSGKVDYSGELYLTENYKYGLLDGISTRYSYLNLVPVPCEELGIKGDDCEEYKQKKVYEKFTYKEGKLNGESLVKNSLGQIISKGQFLRDKKHMTWFEGIDDNYYEQGRYDLGERVGEWDLVFNGRTIRKSQYKNDEVIELSRYNINGFITERFKYEGENNIFHARYSGMESNELLEYIKVLSRRGSRAEVEMVVYFEDTIFVDTYDILSSKNITTDAYLDGKKNGNSQISVNDILLQKGNYKNNKKQDVWIYNYPTQSVQLQVSYYNGGKQVQTERYYILNTKEFFDGDFFVLDKNANEIERRDIKDGLRNGKTIYYDAAGEKIKKEKYKDGVLQ